MASVRTTPSSSSSTVKVLHTHFGEFGQLERIRVLQGKNCAFVTYVREVDAQFAKEAMMHQSLDHNECINLRWATDDPDPSAQKREIAQRKRQGMQAVEAELLHDSVPNGDAKDNALQQLLPLPHG